MMSLHELIQYESDWSMLDTSFYNVIQANDAECYRIREELITKLIMCNK